MNKTKKDTIYVRNEDYENYRDFTQKPEWGYGSNLKLFTTTVLIGKYIVGKRYTGTISHYYLKVEENKTRLEEIFFKATGTYDERLFLDYAAQESADARPDYIPASNGGEETASFDEADLTASKEQTEDKDNESEEATK